MHASKKVIPPVPVEPEVEITIKLNQSEAWVLEVLMARCRDEPVMTGQVFNLNSVNGMSTSEVYDFIVNLERELERVRR